jgi:hypothetical protein
VELQREGHCFTKYAVLANKYTTAVSNARDTTGRPMDTRIDARSFRRKIRPGAKSEEKMYDIIK